MNDPEQSIRIPVDLTNPGQFFACCGLLELADRLWPGTEGWFSSHNCFVLEPRCSGSIDTLISSVIDCELEPLLPAEVRKELRELENKKRERKAEGRTLQKELEKRRKSLSSKRIAAGFRLGRPFQLRVDWWLADDCDGAHLATWAGRQEISEIAIDIKHSLEKVPVDELLDYESLIERRAGGLPRATSQFRFRTRGYRARHRLLCRQSWTADRLLRLDRVLGTYRDPAIRPKPDDDGYFTYRAWHTPLPVAAASVVARGLISQSAVAGRFRLAGRDNEGRYKAFQQAALSEWRS